MTKKYNITKINILPIINNIIVFIITTLGIIFLILFIFCIFCMMNQIHESEIVQLEWNMCIGFGLILSIIFSSYYKNSLFIKNIPLIEVEEIK